MNDQSCVKIMTEWDIVAARQLGRNVAKELGFGTAPGQNHDGYLRIGQKHLLICRQGQVSIEQVNDRGKKGLKIIAEDKGPGIPDIRKVMEDGFSTSGGLGAGLPGVKRLMDEFSLQSVAEEGTEIQAVKWLR